MIFEQAIRESLKAAIEAVQPDAVVFEYWKQPATQELITAAYGYAAPTEENPAGSPVNGWAVFFKTMRPHEPTNPAGTQGWVIDYGIWHFLEHADTAAHANALIENCFLVAKAANECEFTIRRVNNLGFSLDLIERISINDRLISVAQGTLSIQTWRTGDEAS